MRLFKTKKNKVSIPLEDKTSNKKFIKLTNETLPPTARWNFSSEQQFLPKQISHVGLEI